MNQTSKTLPQDSLAIAKMDKETDITFQEWFLKLLNVNSSRGEFGLNYPLGSWCYRDVLRDKEVITALKKAQTQNKPILFVYG